MVVGAWWWVHGGGCMVVGAWWWVHGGGCFIMNGFHDALNFSVDS
jgi:hypothetical protein